MRAVLPRKPPDAEAAPKVMPPAAGRCQTIAARQENVPASKAALRAAQAARPIRKTLGFRRTEDETNLSAHSFIRCLPRPSDFPLRSGSDGCLPLDADLNI